MIRRIETIMTTNTFGIILNNNNNPLKNILSINSTIKNRTICDPLLVDDFVLLSGLFTGVRRIIAFD